jgi:5-methylcytosine-specific restriction protein A
MHLNEFPGALFDTHGYVVFQTQSDFENCPQVSLYESRLSVRDGISSVPGYVRKI